MDAEEFASELSAGLIAVNSMKKVLLWILLLLLIHSPALDPDAAVHVSVARGKLTLTNPSAKLCANLQLQLSRFLNQ